MFTEDKVTEIFCMADDFCKFFDSMMAKYTIPTPKKHKYHRSARVDESLEQARQGRVHRIESKEDLHQFLNSL